MGYLSYVPGLYEAHRNDYNIYDFTLYPSSLLYYNTYRHLEINLKNLIVLLGHSERKANRDNIIHCYELLTDNRK